MSSRTNSSLTDSDTPKKMSSRSNKTLSPDKLKFKTNTPASNVSTMANASVIDLLWIPQKISSRTDVSLASEINSPNPRMSCRTNASLSDIVTTGRLSACLDDTLPPPPKTHNSRDQNIAISVLQKSSSDTGESVYDHLVDIIKRIIVERPKNVVDYFEDFSRRIRQDRYRGDERTQRGFYSTTYRMDVSLTILAGLALNTEPLFLTNSFVNEWMERQSHWSSAGIGFSHEKQLQLTLAMQGLLTNSIVQDARFWGTIYGIEKKYYIAEATLTTAESESRLSLAEDTLLEMELRETQTTLKSSIIGETPSNAELRTKIRDVKKSQHLPLDLNGKVYFVCNDFGVEWTELPAVTPDEIVQSRKIQKYCRGNLEANVRSYPSFTGTEKNYLRALIARISHGTYVTPINPKHDLFDVSNWAHALAEINDDGSMGQIVEMPSPASGSRNSEWSASDRNSSEELMDDDNVRDKTRVSVAANVSTNRVSTNVIAINRPSAANEVGNSQLDDAIMVNSETASTVQSEISMPNPCCANDYFHDRIRPWNISPVDNYCIPDAIIIANSIVWNGSFTLATQKFVDHVYFGWGHKMTSTPIVPPIHFHPEDEYEMTDLECKKPVYE